MLQFESAFNEACVKEVEVKPEELHEQDIQLNTEKNQVTSFTPIDCLIQRTGKWLLPFQFLKKSILEYN